MCQTCRQEWLVRGAGRTAHRVILRWLERERYSFAISLRGMVRGGPWSGDHLEEPWPE
jgi:hypothetical protein